MRKLGRKEIIKIIAFSVLLILMLTPMYMYSLKAKDRAYIRFLKKCEAYGIGIPEDITKHNLEELKQCSIEAEEALVELFVEDAYVLEEEIKNEYISNPEKYNVLTVQVYECNSEDEESKVGEVRSWNYTINDCRADDDAFGIDLSSLEIGEQVYCEANGKPLIIEVTERKSEYDESREEVEKVLKYHIAKTKVNILKRQYGIY